MIDKTKNFIYIIEINYFYKNGEGKLTCGKRTFTSIHGITSKPFREFVNKKMQEIKGFAFLDNEDWGSQYTVPITDHCV